MLFELRYVIEKLFIDNKIQIYLQRSQTKVLNLTHTLPNPSPTGALTPQLGHIILDSKRRIFFN